MSVHKRIVEKYMEGFRRGDHDLVLTCLADDVVWVLHGYKTLRGKDAFEAEIKGTSFEGGLVLTLDRLIEEGDTVVATGSSATETADDKRELVFCELFRFSGEAVSRLDTYHVWLG